DYYLASVADSVYLNPVGEIDFRGLSSEVLFFKDLQEQTGIKMEVIRHGKYKSAVEPFLSDEMSDENRQQITELLVSMWSSVLNDISESRNIPVSELDTIADNLGARTPKLAASNKLVDKVGYFDEYEALLKNAIGIADDEEINYVEIYDYAEHAKKRIKTIGKDKIAVVYAEGEIQYGKGNHETIGQGVMMEALREARDDEDVK